MQLQVCFPHLERHKRSVHTLEFVEARAGRVRGSSYNKSRIFRAHLNADGDEGAMILGLLFHRVRGCTYCAVPAPDSSRPLFVLSLYRTSLGSVDWNCMPWLPELKGELFLQRCITVAPLHRGEAEHQFDDGCTEQAELQYNVERALNQALHEHKTEALEIYPSLCQRIDVGESPVTAVYTTEGSLDERKNFFVILDVCTMSSEF